MHATKSESNQDLSQVLFVSLELSKDDWKLTFGLGGQPNRYRRRTVSAGSVVPLLLEIKYAKAAMKLPEDARVISCYEAGRDGFWLHRALVADGVENHVLDASSLEVDGRAKRLKTDRIDGEKLLRALQRHVQGDRFACRMVHVPPAEDEYARHLQRELRTLREERVTHSNRMRSLLFSLGVRCESVGVRFASQLETCRTGDGAPLPLEVKSRLLRDLARLDLCVRQIQELEKHRDAMYAEARQRLTAGETVPLRQQQAVRLFQLRGIGDESAWTLATELFGWRKFRNRLQVGAVLGLAPVVFASGQLKADQGLSKTGNSRLRSLAIELAWLWLQYQPTSELSRWFQEKYGSGGSRSRRVGIVALARKLMIALWRYAEFGEAPAGSVLKTESQLANHRRTRGVSPCARKSCSRRASTCQSVSASEASTSSSETTAADEPPT